MTEAENLVRTISEKKSRYHSDLVQERIESLQELRDFWRHSASSTTRDVEIVSADTGPKKSSLINPLFEEEEVETTYRPEKRQDSYPEWQRKAPLVIWFHAYSIAEGGEALEAEGRRRDAIAKYQESKRMYDFLVQVHPTFQTKHIEEQQMMLEDKIDKLAKR